MRRTMTIALATMAAAATLLVDAVVRKTVVSRNDTDGRSAPVRAIGPFAGIIGRTLRPAPNREPERSAS